MTINSDGLLYKDELKIGIDELQWLQEEYHERRRRRFLGFMAEPGFIIRRALGTMEGASWRVDDADGDGTLEVQIDDGLVLTPGAFPTFPIAVNEDGQILQLEAEIDVPVVVPDDGVFRTLIVRPSTTEREEGTLAITTGSSTIIGTGTKFTRFAGKTTSGFSRGSNIRIDATDSSFGNEGTYEIDTIVSDTEITIVGLPNGTTESSIDFHIAGDYETVIPADPDIHQRATLEWSLVARTITRPAGGWLIVADVLNDSATLTELAVIDRRRANIYRSLDRHTTQNNTVDIRPRLAVDTSSAPFTGRTAERTTAFSVGAAVPAHVGIAPSQAGRYLMAVENAGTAIVAREYDAAVDTWQNPAAGSAVNITVSATAKEPAVEQVPSARHTQTTTHVCVYVEGAEIRRRLSTDNGATWGLEATIWQPTNVDASDTVDQPDLLLLRSNRLLLSASYFDNSVGDRDIRYIQSDDLGNTWSTNGDAGFASVAVAGQDCKRPHMCQAEDGTIFFVYQVTQTALTDAVILGQSTDEFTLTALNPTTASFLIRTFTGPDLAFSPKVWCAPDGNVAVLYAHSNGSNNTEIRFAILGTNSSSSSQDIAFRRVLYDKQILQLSTGAVGSTDDQSWDLVQGDDGRLHLVIREDTTTINVHHFPHVPVAVPMARRMVQ